MAPTQCSVTPSLFSWSSHDLRERSQRNKGWTPRHGPNPCADTPAGLLPAGGCHCLHRGGGKPQSLLFSLISKRFVFSASFIGLTCGISIYVKEYKTLVIYFSSIWILSLCVLLLRRNKLDNQVIWHGRVDTPYNTSNNICSIFQKKKMICICLRQPMIQFTHNWIGWIYNLNGRSSVCTSCIWTAPTLLFYW